AGAGVCAAAARHLACREAMARRELARADRAAGTTGSRCCAPLGRPGRAGPRRGAGRRCRGGRAVPGRPSEAQPAPMCGRHRPCPAGRWGGHRPHPSGRSAGSPHGGLVCGHACLALRALLDGACGEPGRGRALAGRDRGAGRRRPGSCGVDGPGVVTERLHERLARGAYSLAWLLATPLALAYLAWRARRQPDYLRRIGERLGRHAGPGERGAGAGPLIWIHVVSVGETRAAQPLVRALAERYPDSRLLLTHMTPTGLQTGAELFADLRASGRLEQAMLPWDLPWAVRAFIDAWRPAVGLLMETERWPNLVAIARRRRVPMLLVNGRLSARSLRKGRRWRWLMRPALTGLSAVFAHTEVDAARL